MTQSELTQLFQATFECQDSPSVYFAPGRVNLIGEHIDYNGGSVFPCALDFGTTALVSKRSDRSVYLYSYNFPEQGIISFRLDNMSKTGQESWGIYPKGVFKTFELHHKFIDQGLNILYYGTIPNGAGLSSSASIEVLTGYLLNDLFDLGINRVDLALLTQESENNYVGVNCGIMDQFIIANGKKNHAILLNTDSLDFDYVPFELHDYKLVITNTNVKRGLADSKYNERRQECEEALRILQKSYSIHTLADINLGELINHKAKFNSELIYRRAYHVVSECERTLNAVDALKNHNLKRMGELMNESHRSLRDDYQVSCAELDTLVELSWNYDGVLGSRMTGAGFGGCTISIVHQDALQNYQDYIRRAYTKSFGHEPTFYLANVGDGVYKV